MMFAFLLSLLWPFWPFILIVCFSNYVNRVSVNHKMHSEEPNSSLQQPKVTDNSKDPKIGLFKKKRNRKRKEKASPTEESKEKIHDKKPTEDLIENLHESISTEGIIEDIENPFKIFSKDLNIYTNVNLDHVNVARLFDVNPKISKFFVVDEEVFLDLEPAMISDDQYYNYSLYKVMKTESADMHEIDDEMTDGDLTEELFIKLETEHKNQGVIINSNVYLTYQQWNTFILLDKDIYSCSVCQFQCDGTCIAGHIGSAAHARKLNAHKPLKRFDLSITRKINKNFHCAVCNVMYPIKTYRNHENSKVHEGNLLYAINKVSDLLWSSGTKTTQLLNTNNIQEPNNAPRNIGNTDSCRNIDSGRNADFPRNTDSVRNTQSFADTGASRNMLQKSDDVCSFVEDSRSEHQFNFGKSTFEDIKIYEEDDMEEYTLPIEGVSYASMASKPRLSVPKFLKIDLGTKEVRVKFESWNMVTQIDMNKVYCMVCTESFSIRFKNQHCMEELHRRSLAKCAVVGAFEDYLIRDVSEKLYHCGHCNNLQYKNDMKVHIEKYHLIKNLKTGADKNQSSLRVSPTETYKITDTEDRNIVTNVPSSSVSSEELKSIIKEKLDIFGDFKFSPFGTEIVVSNLNCHTLMLENSEYHCALCNIYVKGDLKEHVYEEAHMQFINMTPFIRPFQSHLTRAIRGSLHCAICNILIPVAGIYDHNVSPAHTGALARALGMVKSERPRNEVKYKFEGPTEFKTTLEKFLSTLPATSREALSKIQIENHKGETIDLSETVNLSSWSTNGTPQISLNNSPSHIKKEDIKNEPPTMTDTNCQKANFKNPLNNASNLTNVALGNAHNLKSTLFFDGYFNGCSVSNANNPIGLPLNSASNFEGPSLKDASNLQGIRLNNAGHPEGLALNNAGHPGGLALYNASNPIGLPLNSASNFEGPSLKDASNLQGIRLNNAGHPEGLALNNAGHPGGLALYNASNPIGLPLNNAGHPGGFALNNASNTIGFSLNNAGHPGGLALNNASNPIGLPLNNAGHPGGLALNNASNPIGLPLNNAGHPGGLALNNASNPIGLPLNNAGHPGGLALNNASNPIGLPLNNAGHPGDLALYNASNPIGLPLNNAGHPGGFALNNASNPIGFPLNNASNFKGPSLIDASNWPGLPLNNAGHPKDLALNYASNPKGLALKNASNFKGPSLKNTSNWQGIPFNASNSKGLALNGASNLSGPPLNYGANMNGLPLETGLVSLNMIESGLPRVGSGARGTPPRPVQLHVAGPLDRTMESGFGRIPVAPFIRSEDIGMVGGLQWPHNQRVEIEKCEPKVKTMTEMIPEMDSKTKNIGKVKGDGDKSTEMTSEILSESTVQSGDEKIAPFKLDETIFLKLKSLYFKVTNTAYQSLVHSGNGARFCFVCSHSLDYSLLQKHVDSREHIDNMSKNKFLYNFRGQLFRQMYLMYHCVICNVTMSGKEVKMHLEWPVHIEKFEQACKKINKKILKVALKSGAKEYCVETQKEFLYVNVPEPSINIVTYVQSSKEDFEETFVEKKLVRKSQMIILKGNMMKICFESWHGIVMDKSGAKCIICQLEFASDSLPSHLDTKQHSVALGMTFEKQFYPALIRKINANTVNCVICNLEVSNTDSLVFEHINGRKHEKNYSIIIEKTSHPDSYGDSYPYPINL